MWRIVLATALMSAGARLAHADQCQWLDDRQVAARAVAALERAGTLVMLCEPCGEHAASGPFAVAHVAANPVREPGVEGYVEVDVNERSIDLAYAYVEVDGRYVNLAKLAGCPATGVSATLPADRVPAGPAIVQPPVAASLAEPAAEPALPAPVPLASELPLAAAEPTPPRAPISAAELARPRWQLGLGAEMGSLSILQQTRRAHGFDFTLGLRIDQLAVFADYSVLDVPALETAGNPGSEAPATAADPSERGRLQRFGVGARWSLLSAGPADPRSGRSELFQLFLEGGSGVQHLGWQTSPAQWREDIAIGGGAQLVGGTLRNGSAIGVLLRVVDLYSHAADHICTGCSRWDNGVLATVTAAYTF
jgi:hypothetical protein